MTTSAISVSLSRVNVLPELERIGWHFEPASDDEVKCRCPAHDDQTSSASINVQKRVWKCHAAGCQQQGDFITFLALALKSTRPVVIADLAIRYGDSESKIVDYDAVERYHAQIMSAGPLLKALRDRGVTDEVIRTRRLGFDGSRITIPILNDVGLCVNIRRYLPGAPADQKMRSLRGHGKIRLYPIDQLKYPQIVVTGGEVKAIVGAAHLNPHNIGCISTTGGEGNWDPAFTSRFKEKQVYVIMDVDRAGTKAGETVSAILAMSASTVKKVDLPLDLDKYPKGDLNDWFGQEQRTAEDLIKLIQDTLEWKTKRALADELPVGPPLEVSLFEATNASNARRYISTKCVVQAMDTSTYLVPKEVVCECTRDQQLCALCPVFSKPNPDDKPISLTVNASSPAILEIVNASKQTQKEALRVALGIPPCKVVEFHPSTSYNVSVAQLSPVLEVSLNQDDSVVVPSYLVSHGVEVGTPYSVSGHVIPHPRTQQATFLCSEVEIAEDALGSFSPAEDELELLKTFQPKDWSYESLCSKLDELYADLSANVTRIYKREAMHEAIDLAYHSVLWFEFDDRDVKGWVEVLIVGDSSQGKSETAMRLMQHYGVGGRVECKNASRAGLIGGLQQFGSRWVVTRGLIPRYDRQLLFLEELKGASTEIIGRLTDMRSTGIAEVDKIESRKMYARTRIVALSNPRSDMPISSYSYGIQTIPELIGSPEDVRRFDLGLVLSSSQVSAAELSKLVLHRPNIPHKHESYLCMRLILWAWTRKVEQVLFEDGTTTQILEEAARLCDKYTDLIPLVDRGSMRHKLARMAVACAARTFSVDESMQSLVVRTCHVRRVVHLIESQYDQPSCGYLDLSNALKLSKGLQNEDQICKRLLTTPFPRDFVESLLSTEQIELRDVMDWSGWDRSDAVSLLSFLVRKRALKRIGPSYRKHPDLIILLKKLMQSDDMELADRPDHIEEI